MFETTSQSWIMHGCVFDVVLRTGRSTNQALALRCCSFPSGTVASKMAENLWSASGETTAPDIPCCREVSGWEIPAEGILPICGHRV